MERRRRAVASPLGRVELNDAPNILSVDDPTANRDMAQHHYGQQIQENAIPEHLRNNPNININTNNESELSDAEERIREARQQARRQPAKREAVNRLEILLGIGRLTDNVVVDNTTFSIRSLKSRENREVMRISSKEETKFDELMTIKNATLAYSIYEIDGQPLVNFIRDDSIESRLDLIEDLDSNLVNTLFDKYSKMLDAYQKTANEDLGKTPKEFADNLKK